MSKISLEGLKALEAIERCGSFALAAKELHKVPSALTYTINTLEAQLKIKIFDRTGHRAKITPLGEVLLQEGRKLLISADEIEKRLTLIRSGYEKKLLIAYDQLIPFSNLLFLIDEFTKTYPDIELKVSAEVLSGCWDALLSNRAVIAIGTTGDSPVRDDIAVSPLGPVEFVFTVAKNHPLAAQNEKLTNTEIASYTAIAVADSTRSLSTRTSGILPNQDVITVNTFHEKIQLILAGHGVGYLPLAYAKPYLDSGELVAKDLPRLKSKGSIALAWRISLIGQGGKWLINRLMDPNVIDRILAV